MTKTSTRSPVPSSSAQLAARGLRVPRSGIRELMRLASQKPHAIHLEVGQPDFHTPPHVVRAAHEAALAGETTYTPNAGTNALREAIARRYQRLFRLSVESEQVLVSPGAMAAVTLALFATLDPGDEILMPEPGFPNYGAAAEIAGAVRVPYPLRFTPNGWDADIDSLEALVGPRTKALLINSPSNPTGELLSPSQWNVLLDFARRRNLYVISDEVYDELVFHSEPSSALQWDSDGRVLAVSGVSKTYAMTGWRIGWLISAQPVVAHAARFVEALYSCPSSISQAAALAALTGPQNCVAEMLAAYKDRANLVEGLLNPPGLLLTRPRGAFYAMVDIRRSRVDADTFARGLLDRHDVAVAPGGSFGSGGQNWVRLSFVNRLEVLEDGIRRLLGYLDECAHRSRASSR